MQLIDYALNICQYHIKLTEEFLSEKRSEKETIMVLNHLHKLNRLVGTSIYNKYGEVKAYVTYKGVTKIVCFHLTNLSMLNMHDGLVIEPIDCEFLTEESYPLLGYARLAKRYSKKLRNFLLVNQEFVLARKFFGDDSPEAKELYQKLKEARSEIKKDYRDFND